MFSTKYSVSCHLCIISLLYDRRLAGWVQGLIHVQYKQSFSMPVISHMEEGVTDSNLSALQNRVGKDTLRQRGPRPNPEFIDVSP